MTMCISTKRSLKRSATAKKTAAAITFSKPCILATHHMNCTPRSNDLSILVNRVLRQYQQQSSQPEPAVASKSTKSPKKCVRFDASVKMPETSSPQVASTQNGATLKTSQLLLQVRIVLKILEKEEPRLRHRLVQSIDRLRKTLPKGRTFNRSVDTLMRGMVKPATYQMATEARMRLTSAV